MTKFSAFILAGALALPTAAIAGPYVGVGIGGSRLETDVNDIGLAPQEDVNTDFSSTDVGFQYLAGWRFGTYFAIEAGWVDFGDQKQLYELPELCNGTGCQSREWEAEVQAEGWQAYVLGFYPITDNVEVYGKLGALGWDVDLKGVERQLAFQPPPAPTGSESANPPRAFSDDGTDLAGAIGLNLKTDSAVSLRTEFTWFDVENTDQTWLLSLTAVYNFGGTD